MLFELVNIGTLSAFIIVSAGILWMRKTQPDAHRGFRAPGVPFTPICAIIFCFILICGLNWETWVRFAIWFALGFDRVFRVQPQAFRIERARTSSKNRQYGCFRYIFT